MLLEKLKNYHLILATKSPRRHQLMMDSGFQFDIRIPEGIEENYPDDLKIEVVPEYLAELKASWFLNKLNVNEIVISADTIVIFRKKILGKPLDRDEAISMLRTLRGKSHTVITGVCIMSKEKKKLFSSFSTVCFGNFSDEEISFYVDKFKPYDKAGSYGAQEWIGYIGIEKIEGSFFNVMGLPVQQLYVELEKFIEDI
jgi:septum formation protein